MIEWNGSPEIFRSGSFAVRWYGLLFSGAFYFAYLFLKKIYKREGKNPQDVDVLLYWTVSLTLIGARLAHCLFYQWDYFSQNPIKILYIWEGGLASHGAGVGLILAGYLYIKGRKNQSFLWMLDRITLASFFGGAMIRMGNFFNSEIVGRASDLPWAITFLKVDNIPRHPVQLYESFYYLSMGLIMLRYFNRNWDKKAEGTFFALNILAIFVGRFVLETVKESPIKALGLTTGQWLSIPYCIAAIAGYMYLQKKNPRL